MHVRHTFSVLVALTIAVGFLAIPSQAAEPSQASLLKQAKVSKQAAAKTALAKVPGGTIKSSELENEHGALVWSFDIAMPKSRNIHEVQVNAVTGAVAHSEIETPKDQARELEQDRKEAK
ncbi:MAG: PepSY domain-containing protein [Thermomonas sp.]